jgi:hypothetical protein
VLLLIFGYPPIVHEFRGEVKHGTGFLASIHRLSFEPLALKCAMTSQMQGPKHGHDSTIRCLNSDLISARDAERSRC